MNSRKLSCSPRGNGRGSARTCVGIDRKWWKNSPRCRMWSTKDFKGTKRGDWREQGAKRANAWPNLGKIRKWWKNSPRCRMWSTKVFQAGWLVDKFIGRSLGFDPMVKIGSNCSEVDSWRKFLQEHAHVRTNVREGPAIQKLFECDETQTRTHGIHETRCPDLSSVRRVE